MSAQLQESQYIPSTNKSANNDIYLTIATTKSTYDKALFFDKNTTDINLTLQEKRCLYYLLQGLSAKEIGKVLGISNRTAESYLKNVKQKFNCQSNLSLAIKAIRLGYFI